MPADDLNADRETRSRERGRHRERGIAERRNVARGFHPREVVFHRNAGDFDRNRQREIERVTERRLRRSKPDQEAAGGRRFRLTPRRKRGRCGPCARGSPWSETMAQFFAALTDVATSARTLRRDRVDHPHVASRPQVAVDERRSTVLAYFAGSVWSKCCSARRRNDEMNGRSNASEKTYANVATRGITTK